MINLHNTDCLEAMKQMKDNQFDLAIVDVPYGIGVNKMTLGNGKKRIYRGKEDWDNKPPSKEYFIELFRVSKNQFIWGANHFIEQFNRNSSNWIVWDKGTGDNDFADAELAWGSFKKTVKMWKVSWVGANAKEKNDIGRIHPTQKPVQLYEWLLMNYAKEGDKILDTHCGSGSIMIACDRLGFDLEAFELDTDYYEASLKRFKEQTAQLRIM